MKSLSLLGLLLVLVGDGLPNSLAEDMVLRWTQVLASTIRVDTTRPGPAWASRNSALVHLAIFEAVNAIQRTYEPFYEYVPAAPGALPDAAAAQAAYRVLVALYPAQVVSLEVNLGRSLAGLTTLGRDAGVAVGNRAADLVLARRAADGASEPSEYQPSSAPGHWRPDPLHPTQTALGANWGRVTPFILSAASQFRAPVPPALNSPEYASAYQEVLRIGRRVGSDRTPEQTEIAIFWGYDRAGLGPPPLLFHQIAEGISVQRHFTLEDNARLFAMVDVAQADAAIACWESKFFYDYWRPVTAIREGNTDGNEATEMEPAWEPLGAPAGGIPWDFTPPFPAYPSGHATFGAAVFRILEWVCGTDTVDFIVTSEEVPAAPRTFHRLSSAALENARSRIYLGVHWNFDDTEGRVMGRKIADQLFANRFAPVLRAGRTDGTFQLLWPANIRGFRVEQSRSIGGVDWTPMDGQPLLDGEVQKMTSPMIQNSFYRLARWIP